MITFPAFDTIDEAWVGVLEAAEKATRGRLLHAIVAVASPGMPVLDVVDLNNQVLSARGTPGDHLVDTVASTIFPANMYAPPDFDYSPTLSDTDLAQLNLAAEDLYERYREMLPDLCGFSGNSHGTYFGRLVSWPGKTSRGYNQLKRRVDQIRLRRDRGDSATNAADFALEGIAEVESADTDGLGLQIYKSDDERTQGFPCLVHLDISVVENRLHIMAVYRHWHLVHKAYGNMIGLSRLLHFLAQQTGYEAGELMIHATVANAEISPFNHTVLRKLITDAKEQLDKHREVV